jgi:hypothetical protein
VGASETWGEILRPQALDLTLFAAFTVLALVSFFRKSVRLKYITLAAAVGYLGFCKSSLMSISDVFRLTDMSLPPFTYSLAWYAFAGFVIVSTVLWGRLYCGRICAFGALTQLMDAVLPKKLRVDVPPAIERRAVWIKYGVLVALVGYYIVTKDLARPVQYAEPFWMFSLFDPDVDRARHPVDGHRVRSQFVLPVPVSVRRRARHPLQSHRVPDQAVVGVQDLQDLREDL